MRIAVAVENERELESACSASLETATSLVVAELEGGVVKRIETLPNPWLADAADEAALQALRLDVLVAATALEHTRGLLLAQGVQVALGACGTARRALISYITNSLGAVEPHAHP